MGLRSVQPSKGTPKAANTQNKTTHTPQTPLLNRSVQQTTSTGPRISNPDYQPSLYKYSEDLLKDEVTKRTKGEKTSLDFMLALDATPPSDEALSDTLGLIDFQTLSTETLKNGGSPKSFVTKNLDSLRALYKLPIEDRASYIQKEKILQSCLFSSHSLNIFRFVLSSVPKSEWANLLSQQESSGFSLLHRAANFSTDIPEGFLMSIINVLAENPNTLNILRQFVGLPPKDANDPSELLQSLVKNRYTKTLQYLKTTLAIDDLTWNALLCQRTHDNNEVSLPEIAFFNNQWELGYELFNTLSSAEQSRILTHLLDDKTTLWHNIARTSINTEIMPIIFDLIEKMKMEDPTGQLAKKYFLENRDHNGETPMTLATKANRTDLINAFQDNIVN